jgi:hypothetical protein
MPEIITLQTVSDVLGKDEEAEEVIRLLILGAKKGYIKAVDPEVLLVLSHFRLAVPKNSVNFSLAWNSRIISAGCLEIPYIVRDIFIELAEKGEVNLERCITDYFRKIGERNPEEFYRIFLEIIGESERYLVCGNSIVKVSEKYGRDGGVVISELKGAGLISPFSGCGNLFQHYGKKFQSPVYETNRFLHEIVLRKR